MQSQIKDEMFTVLEQYHKILQNENLKAAPDKSHFFLTRVKFLGHNIDHIEWTTEHQTQFDETKKTFNRTNFKHHSRSKPTILPNVRCFKLWHRRSIITIT